MADPIDFLPLASETIQAIRARLDADANVGVSPEDDAYLDTIEGGFFFDLTQAVALEMERLWDFAATEVPAATFIQFAWGDYLDEHGAAVGVDRKDAARATGEVTFTGTNGTVISPGVQLATPTTDPDEEARAYQVVAGGTVSGGTLTVAVEAVDVGAAGNTPANSVTLLMTPVSGVAAVTNVVAISGGADIETDEQYRDRLLLEFTSQGAGTRADYERWALAYPGIGYATVQPLWAGGGTVRVMVTDPNNDPVSQTARDGLQAQLDPFNAINQLNGSHTLPVGTITVDSTTGFRTFGRIRVADQLVNYTAITSTTFTGCTGGTGTFPDNTAVVQSGEGRGQAPIGAEVYVDTPVTLAVNVSAAVAFDPGYSLDGTGGTIATRDDISTSLSGYIDNVEVGEDIVLNHVESRFFRVRGVYDVTGTQLNGVAANLTVAANQVAALGTVILT